MSGGLSLATRFCLSQPRSQEGPGNEIHFAHFTVHEKEGVGPRNGAGAWE